jgi:hypothetical protein
VPERVEAPLLAGRPDPGDARQRQDVRRAPSPLRETSAAPRAAVPRREPGLRPLWCALGRPGLAELPLSFSDDKAPLGPRGVPSTPKERDKQDVSADDGNQHQCPPSQAGHNNRPRPPTTEELAC